MRSPLARRPRHRYAFLTTLSAVAVGTLAVSGCSSSADSGGSTEGATAVSVTLTSDGCGPSPSSVAAGLTTFVITNKNASAVTEAELVKGATILGEKENLTPGLSGSFSLRLEPGTYSMYCPNAKNEHAEFIVTGNAASASADPERAAMAAAAVQGYHDYVVDEVNQLVVATGTFTTAIKAGDIAAAKATYGPARTHYESIEPVAESFGDLDPEIDARIDDIDDVANWTGFHRLEKALWEDNSLAGMDVIADKLTTDIAKLQSLVATQTYQAAQIANGSLGLLDEVARTKVTGEEERYSHTDLYDFEANVLGAQKGFTLIEPLLTATDPTLATTIEARFADVLAAIEQYRQGDGWVDYSTVSQDARRVLAQKVDALAEPLSTVAAKIG